MNLIINEGESVSLHKHPIGIFAQDVSQIVEPLKKSFGIHHFGYGKLVSTGEQLYLTNNPSFSEDFINYQFYKIAFLSDPKDYQSRYTLLDTLPSNDIVKLLEEKYDIGHCLVIFRRQETYCESFIFGTSVDNIGMSNVYLNHLPMFNAFADYFKERARELIQASDLSRIQAPAQDCQETLLKQELEHASINFSFPSLLTAKEKECAFFLTQCLSLKEVAIRMSISPRTLEKHIASLKSKLGCKNMTSLVVRLRGWYEFNYK